MNKILTTILCGCMCLAFSVFAEELPVTEKPNEEEISTTEESLQKISSDISGLYSKKTPKDISSRISVSLQFEINKPSIRYESGGNLRQSIVKNRISLI